MSRRRKVRCRFCVPVMPGRLSMTLIACKVDEVDDANRPPHPRRSKGPDRSIVAEATDLGSQPIRVPAKNAESTKDGCARAFTPVAVPASSFGAGDKSPVPSPRTPPARSAPPARPSAAITRENAVWSVDMQAQPAVRRRSGRDGGAGGSVSSADNMQHAADNMCHPTWNIGTHCTRQSRAVAARKQQRNMVVATGSPSSGLRGPLRRRSQRPPRRAPSHEHGGMQYASV